MSCTRCGNICNSLTIQSSDGLIGIDKITDFNGCIFTLTLLGNTNTPAPYYLQFDNSTRLLCIKDTRGTVISCATIPDDGGGSGSTPQTLSIEGNILTISDGNSVTLPDIPTTNVSSSTLDVTESGDYGQNITIELTPSTQDGNILVIGTDGKPYVPTSGGGSDFPDAPSDGKIYGRKNGAWVEITGAGGDLYVDITNGEIKMSK